jgi:hypothetical protein
VARVRAAGAALRRVALSRRGPPSYDALVVEQAESDRRVRRIQAHTTARRRRKEVNPAGRVAASKQ